jgi:hypothetical protein
MTNKARPVLWYPTQTKTGLEWGTQPSLEGHPLPTRFRVKGPYSPV